MAASYMMEISRGPPKAEKFEIARRSMSISVHGAIGSISRTSLEYGFFRVRRQQKKKKTYDASSVTISGSFKFEIASIIMNECLLLAGFAFYEELYLVQAAYFRESRKVRNRTRLNC